MYFPLFVDLSDKNILVVGGGEVAARRIHILLDFAGKIRLVAPRVKEELRSPGQSGKLIICPRDFKENDLPGADIVLAATDDAALNRKIAELCRERGIPVNVCSDRALCDFRFPSVVTDGDVVVGINTSGKDYKKAKEARQKMEELLSAQSLYGGSDAE